MGESANVLVRVWLPDRPGALGLVASRIGAVRGDIVGIDVLERDQGVVIDEFAVRLADLDLLAVLVKEVEEVDGASVEEVRIVGRFPDPGSTRSSPRRRCARRRAPRRSAQRLVGADPRRVPRRVERARCATRELLAVGRRAPRRRTSSQALAAGHAWRRRRSPRATTGPGDLAVATLDQLGAMLLVGRDGQTVPPPRAGAALRAGPGRRPRLGSCSSRGSTTLRSRR